MENPLVVSNKFSLSPSTLSEAIKYAEIMARSDIVPKEFRGKPENVLVAVQMGAELGLSPLQAVQNISIINGKANIYGDAALALVQQHPAYEAHEEYVENNVGVFRIKRKGQDWHEVRFTMDQAKKAGLWGKPGPWTNYPDRMLQLRARGFALRDKFADALKGLITREEAQDYTNGQQMHVVQEIKEEEKLTEEHLMVIRELIEESHSEEEVVVSTMSPKFHVIHEEAEKLENFPDTCFDVLFGMLKKKIQLNKEMEEKRNLLNAG